jgi:hypothetical protein
MDESKLPHADVIVIDELIKVNKLIIKAIALVRSGTPDKESGELVEIAESHLETGMKLLARAAISPGDRHNA